MQRLQEVRETREIRLSFTAVDGSRPVELNPAQCAALIVILGDWPETMPDDLLEFRNALIADLHRQRVAAARSLAPRAAPQVGGDGWITRHVEVGGGRPSLAGWLVVAWVSDGEAARLHIRTNRRTIVMPTVLRIVIDTVTSGSAAKG